MKKIKHIKQLKAEKMKLKQKEEDLELIIRNDWRELKNDLKPGNLGKDVVGLEGFRVNWSYGAAILAATLLGRAGMKIAKIFKARA